MVDIKQATAGDIDLGSRVRSLRGSADLTIKEVAARSGGLSTSSISKIENGQLSPSYENIIKLARGLGVDIAELFSDTKKQTAVGKRSITKCSKGRRFNAQHYDYEMLCTDLVAKNMVPLKATIRAPKMVDFGPLITHDGEEVLLVLSGEVVLHTKFYEPVLLRTGNCAYFDSTMGHACLVKGLTEATVFWVCFSSEVIDRVTRDTG